MPAGDSVRGFEPNATMTDVETPRRQGPSSATNRHAWLDREVYALLGLPFDAVNMAQALAAVRHAVTAGERLFLTTPNTNFAMTALTNPSFRASVLHSDLCIIDGMPLVWAARLLNLPIKERVAGADLFERLLEEPGPTIKVYFFGGPDGAAAAACRAVNLRSGAMRCVGYQAPGYGGVDEMSSQRVIDAINACGPDMVVVALGAQKGQEWIMRNRDRLHAPVLTHLGAVVNFVANTISRAPHWMRRTGLEWVWRIMQEPHLWSRYLRDGSRLLRVGMGQLLPQLLRNRRALARTSGAEPTTALTIERRADAIVLTLQPSSTDAMVCALRKAFDEAMICDVAVEIDARQVTTLAPRVLGMLLVASVRLPGLRWLHPNHAPDIGQCANADTVPVPRTNDSENP
ncbi:MAG: WecB/TagA/CpsF family glycosyltransferase [Burkholderiales bacterium]